MIFGWFGRNRRIAEQALQCAREAAEIARGLNRAMERALELVNRQARELEGVRSELAAFHAGTMDEDAQTAELERMHAVKGGRSEADR